MGIVVESGSSNNICPITQLKFVPPIESIIYSIAILSFSTLFFISILTLINGLTTTMPPSLKELSVLNEDVSTNEEEYVYTDDCKKTGFCETSISLDRSDEIIPVDDRDGSASCSSDTSLERNSIDVKKWLGSERSLLGIEVESKGITAMLLDLTQSEIDEFDDDSMPIRFLREYKGDTRRALKALRATLQWRKEFDVAGLLAETSNIPPNPEDYTDRQRALLKIGAIGSAYTRGYDKDGRALHLCDALLLKPFVKEVDDVVRGAVLATEKSIACTKRMSAEMSKDNVSLEKFVVAFDFSSYRANNKLPLWFTRRLLQVSQAHYPGRIHKAFLLNTPKVFEVFWNILKPFVNPAVRDVVVFCSADDFAKEVLDPNKLEPKWGGPKENPVRDFNMDEYKDLPFSVSFDE